MSADIAATVTLELRRNRHGATRASQQEMDAIVEAVRNQCAEQSNPYYATAGLCDDGIIEPVGTRDVLGLCLDIVTTVPPIGEAASVFRM